MSSSSSNTKMFGNWMQKAEEFKKRAKEKVDLMKDKIEEQNETRRLHLGSWQIGFNQQSSNSSGSSNNNNGNNRNVTAASASSKNSQQQRTTVTSSPASELVNRMDSLELTTSMNAEQAAREVEKLHPGFFEPYRKGEDEDETDGSEGLSTSSSNNDSTRFDALRESLKEIPRDFCRRIFDVRKSD